jgi:hypothetical protein
MAAMTLTGMSLTSTNSTRRALHSVAELVLAGPQHRASGHIRLTVTPTGFRTFTQPDLRVDGVDLVAAGQRLPIEGRTCAELAAAAGVRAGEPDGLYHDGSGADPEEVLHVDRDAAAWIERCWAAGAEALARLDPGQEPILWPEHFDVGIQSDGIGYGVSPGDQHVDEPYAYVSPGTARNGEFWNAPFGAARPMRDLDGGSPDAVLAFFVEGRRRAGT